MPDLAFMEREMKILVIDDDPFLQRLVEASLIKESFTMVFASSGEEGLEKANEIVPDLILLDVIMPGIDGFEVCRQIRNSNILQHVPVIILTALDDRDSKIQGLEAGADDYICKPFDKIEFKARVKTIIRLSRISKIEKLTELETIIMEKDRIIEEQKKQIAQLLSHANLKA